MHRTSASVTRARRALPWAALLLAGLAGGCSSTSDPAATPGPGGQGGAGGQGGGGEGGSASDLPAKEYFQQEVLPGLNEACKLCHFNSGIADFLLGNNPDEQYANITAYKGVINDQPIVWPIPAESILYAYPDVSDHQGTKFAPDRLELKARVLAWLTKEAKNLPPPEDGPIDYIVPFKPIIGGLNAIYLDPLGPDYVGSAITFVANELGTPPSILSIERLEVYPANIVLRFVHPLFSVYPADSSTGEPDPADSMSDLDQTFMPQKDPTCGTGKVFLTNWQSGARLALDFSRGKIEKYLVGADGGIVVKCNDAGAYQHAVETLGDGGPQYCAKTCHGGARAEAKAAMNLSGLLESPPNYESACAFMRARIEPKDVELSQIIEVTNPGNLQVTHMFKFNGKPADYTKFKTGMSEWINAE